MHYVSLRFLPPMSHGAKWVGRLRAGFVLASMVFLVTYYAPLAAVAIQPLESRFAKIDANAINNLEGIIVLGGSFDRVIEAVRLAQAFPDTKLVISGFNEDRSLAYALAAGISPERLILETTSRSTFQNAVHTARVLPTRQGRGWLLVTSAFHMARAMGSFRAAGVDVLPWPITSVDIGLTRSDGLARHEVLGLLAYRVLGRTHRLYPGPDERG